MEHLLGVGHYSSVGNKAKDKNLCSYGTHILLVRDMYPKENKCRKK